MDKKAVVYRTCITYVGDRISLIEICLQGCEGEMMGDRFTMVKLYLSFA